MWLDIKGAVVADTVYADKQLVAKDVSFTLPALSLASAEVKAMGTMSVPIVGQLDNMELSITKVGVDRGLGRMNRLEKQNFEFRWVQNIVTSDGSVREEGCKAFVRTLPGNFPGLGIEVGSTTEGETSYGVTRVQIFVGGEEVMLADRLSQILRVNGVDYMKQINSLL